MNYKILLEDKDYKAEQFESRYMSKIPRLIYCPENMRIEYRANSKKHMFEVNPFLLRGGIIMHILARSMIIPTLDEILSKYSYQFILNDIFVDCSFIASKLKYDIDRSGMLDVS